MKQTNRAKALEIPIDVKWKVAKRDSWDGCPCCIFCGRPSPAGTSWSNAHVVPRSQGGLGIEQNIVTACPECHRKLDQTVEREEMQEYAERYLKTKYKAWTRQKCTFRPWGRTKQC